MISTLFAFIFNMLKYAGLINIISSDVLHNSYRITSLLFVLLPTVVVHCIQS
jgi:hypothetical protein